MLALAANGHPLDRVTATMTHWVLARQMPDGRWLAAGRMSREGKPQTVVARLDLGAGTLTPLVTLPSGGDNGYAGMVWHDGKLWMSYYSSHEGKGSIYRVKWQP